jgi:hypothetical protein
METSAGKIMKIFNIWKGLPEKKNDEKIKISH